MKNATSLILFLLIVSNIKSQEIISVTPDNSTQGENIELTITGQNMHFTQASNTSVWFSQGSNTIIYPEAWSTPNDNSIVADFSFDLNAQTGTYDVNTSNSVDGNIWLTDGFTLNPYSADTFLLSISPTEAHQNETIGFTISGYNTNFTQGSNTVWFSQGSNTINSIYTFAESDHQIYSEFSFSESDPLGSYDINVLNSIDGTLILENEITLLQPIQYPELVSISPNEANRGDIIELTISGENTNFSQATNTVWFIQGSNTTIYPTNTNILNDNTILADFKFSNNYYIGLYDVKVYNYIDGTLYLNDGFTLNDNPTPPEIISVTPDKAPRNQDITLTITGQNTNFNQGSNLVRIYRDDSNIEASSYSVLSETKLEADFSIDTTNIVGLYNVSVFNDFDGDLFLENGFQLDYGTFISYGQFNKIVIFPNPTNGIFKIENIPTNNCTIDIISLDGKIIGTYSNEDNSFIDISLNNLKGYYIVRIRDGKNKTTQKILIY